MPKQQLHQLQASSPPEEIAYKNHGLALKQAKAGPKIEPTRGSACEHFVSSRPVAGAMIERIVQPGKIFQAAAIRESLSIH